MKIKCTCGEVIPDQTDYLSYKAHIIGEKNYFDFLDTINEAIESTEENREKLCNNVRQAEANRLRIFGFQKKKISRLLRLFALFPYPAYRKFYSKFCQYYLPPPSSYYFSLRE